MEGELLIGIYALACLLTTVSGCVVFTAVSGGNVAGAVFNASLANVLGIFISPLLISLLLQSTSAALSVAEVVSIFLNLGLKMLMSIVAGQILRRFFTEFAVKKKKMSVLSHIFILMSIFLALSKSAGSPLFKEHLRIMLLPFAYLAVSNRKRSLWGFPCSPLISLIPLSCSVSPSCPSSSTIPGSY